MGNITMQWRVLHETRFDSCSVEALAHVANAQLIHYDGRAGLFFLTTSAHVVNAYMQQYVLRVNEPVGRIEQRKVDFHKYNFYVEYNSMVVRNQEASTEETYGYPILTHSARRVLAVTWTPGKTLDTVQAIGQVNNLHREIGEREVNIKYLSQYCIKVPFELAVSLHPELFCTKFFDVQ